jgi:hypothetical protein
VNPIYGKCSCSVVGPSDPRSSFSPNSFASLASNDKSARATRYCSKTAKNNSCCLHNQSLITTQTTNKMNFTSSNTPRSFREAVVLNNLAARMLERGAFVQAAETLKDAVSLIRSSVNNDDNIHQQRDESASSAQKLHNARLRFMESLKQQQKARRIASSKSSHLVNVQVLPNDSTTLSSHTAAAVTSSPTTTSSFMAIHIDNYDRADKDADAISAILFYNFGLSYYCLSKTMSTSSSLSKEAAKYSKGALRLFRISHSLCAKVLQSKVGGVECPALLHVMAIILEALTKFLFESNQVEQAKVFCSMLNQVRYVLKETTLRLGLLDGVAAAAAA